MKTVHDGVAAGARHAQPIGGDRSNVLGPGVDGPHFVSRFPQKGRVDRAHGSGSDDCDLHIIPWVGRRPGMLRRASSRTRNHGDEGDVGGHDQPAGPTMQAWPA